MFVIILVFFFQTPNGEIVRSHPFELSRQYNDRGQCLAEAASVATQQIAANQQSNYAGFTAYCQRVHEA